MEPNVNNPDGAACIGSVIIHKTLEREAPSAHPQGDRNRKQRRRQKAEQEGGCSSPRTPGSPCEDSRLRKDTSTSAGKRVWSKIDGSARDWSPLCTDSDNSILQEDWPTTQAPRDGSADSCGEQQWEELQKPKGRWAPTGALAAPYRSSRMFWGRDIVEKWSQCRWYFCSSQRLEPKKEKERWSQQEVTVGCKILGGMERGLFHLGYK